MFDSVPIRTKLAAALAIPLVALIVFSSFVVLLSVRDAGEAEQRAARIRDQVALATSSVGTGGVLSAVLAERNAEAVIMLGMNGADLRGSTDTAITQFRDRMASAPQAVGDIYGPSLLALDGIAAIRAETDEDKTPRSLGDPAVGEMYDRYATIVTTLSDANSKVALAVDDDELRNAATLIDLTARDRAFGTDLTQVLLNTLQTNLEPTAVARVAEAQANIDVTDDILTRTAVGPYEALVAGTLADPRITGYRSLARKVAIRESADVGALIGPAAATAAEAWQDLDTRIGAQLTADAGRLQSAADQAVADARDRTRNAGGLAIAVLLVAGFLTLLATRAISRPLVRLATDADDIAANRLPGAVEQILATPLGEDVVVPALDPVPAGGGVEINEIGVALDSVQTSAADLAVGQVLLRRSIADSFVNLGRRSQNLLSQQIESITEMEREATDAASLERISALDRLAARMRRNAESLLILGGLVPQRQWSAPVPLAEVLRGALDEVEGHHRVEIRYLDDAFVEGSATADVTHVLAELLENALRFSPPERVVEILGRGGSKSYALAIVDEGVGMSEESRREANRRLSGQESFTVAPSRYLGHYSIGVQATRLGVKVRLDDSPTGGVVAQIELGAVLADMADVSTQAATENADAPTVAATASVATTEAAEPEPAPVHEFVAEPDPDRFVPPLGVTRRDGDDGDDGDGDGAPVVEDGGEAQVTASGYRRRIRADQGGDPAGS